MEQVIKDGSPAPAAEVCVEPDLPNWQHDIAGRLCIIDQTTLVIRDFGYDGGGPGMTLQCLLFFIIRS